MKTWYNDATTNFKTFRKSDKPHRKRGRDLVVGDVMFVSGESRSVTGFDKHPGLEAYGKFYTARVMRSGDYGITIFDDDLFLLLSSGDYIHSHLWYDKEARS